MNSGPILSSERCGFRRESANVTDFYNAILSGSYLATEQRKNGEALRSAFTLEEIVAEIRQVLYLDSFTGMGHINIVLDEDIAMYMKHLPGIPPALRERVYDPFVTTKDPDVGTGLGLAIALDIVREHRGVLDLRPRRGSGACFASGRG